METEEINYYSILSNLRELEYNLLNSNTIETIDLSVLAIKKYIFSEKILRDKYISEIRVLEKKYEIAGSYEKENKEVVEQYRKITKKRAEKNNRKVFYNPDSVNGFVQVYNEKEELAFLFEPASLYLFTSVFFPNAAIKNKESDIKDFKISNGLKEMYNKFDYAYNNLLIPENIEYYISTFDSILTKEHGFIFKKIFLIYVASCIYYVIYQLQLFINSEIENLLSVGFDNKIKEELKNNKYNLTDEEINILRLRKELEKNTYKEIGNHLTPKLSESNVTQKFMNIKNKLGANSPDEAVSIFFNN